MKIIKTDNVQFPFTVILDNGSTPQHFTRLALIELHKKAAKALSIKLKNKALNKEKP